jgi:hypothetical protein
MDKAGDILKSFLSFYRLGEGEKYVSFFSDWKSIVGEDIACHARAVDIRKEALLVEVDHPGWMQILQMKQADILKLIARKHPGLGIRVLHMRLVKEGDPSPPVSRAPSPVPDLPPPSCEPAEAPDKTALEKSPLDRIVDEDFKKQLKSLGTSIRSRAKRNPRP